MRERKECMTRMKGQKEKMSRKKRSKTKDQR